MPREQSSVLEHRRRTRRHRACAFGIWQLSCMRHRILIRRDGYCPATCLFTSATLYMPSGIDTWLDCVFTRSPPPKLSFRLQVRVLHTTPSVIFPVIIPTPVPAVHRLTTCLPHFSYCWKPATVSTSLFYSRSDGVI